METMTPKSIINLAPSTKEQVLSFANQLIEDVDAGTVNPLDLQAQMVLMEKSFEIVKEAIASYALREAEKHGQKTFEYKGCNISVKELGVKYYFAGCCDPDWERADSSEKMYRDIRQDREIFLKTLQKSITLLNEETGEVIIIHPPRKTSTTGVTVTAK